MTLEEHFRRTFSELTERIRGEVSRQTAAAAEELIAATERHLDEGVAAAVSAAADNRAAAQATSIEKPVLADSLEHLLDTIRVLDHAASLSDILDALTQHAGVALPRAAMFLVRGSSLEGWRFVGFGPDLDGARKPRVPLDASGLIATVVRTGVSLSDHDSSSPPFAGLAPGRRSLALPLVVAGDVMAVLYGDAGASDSPGTESSDALDAQRVALLEVAVSHAARCLEVITALRAGQIVARVSIPSTSPEAVVGHAGPKMEAGSSIGPGTVQARGNM